MKPDYKLTNKSGIYQLRNVINGKIYIGRTKCFYKRCHNYKYDFKNKVSGRLNDHLYNSMKKYGIENFKFEVVEFCPVEITPERELHWILFKKSNDKLKGYNIRLDVKGHMVASTETRIKISNTIKLQWKNGLRSGHSEKLKKSWNQRDRKKQSRLLTKTLTKYKYFIFFSYCNPLVCKYKILKLFGFANVVTTFHQYKTNEVLFKNCVIRREPING